MSTDIHFFAEKRVNNQYKFISEVSINRNYLLFYHLNLLANTDRPKYMCSKLKRMSKNTDYHALKWCTLSDILHYDWLGQEVELLLSFTGESYLDKEHITNPVGSKIDINFWYKFCVDNDIGIPEMIYPHKEEGKEIRPFDVVTVWCTVPLAYAVNDFICQIPYLKSLESDRFVFFYDN